MNASQALDTLTLNAILAALDERSARLARELDNLLTHPASADRDFALECVADAARDTRRAQVAFDAEWTEPELREAYGR